MIGTFKKIWEFSGEERGNINKSVAVSFLNAVFHMFEIGAIYFVVMALTNGDKDMKTVWISLGSAIASDKEILVFDEPTSGLDYHHMLEVADNLQRLSDMGKTLFIITHDPELIAKCCNYFVFIEHGKTVWSGGWTDGNKKRIADFFSFAV